MKPVKLVVSSLKACACEYNQGIIKAFKAQFHAQIGSISKLLRLSCFYIDQYIEYTKYSVNPGKIMPRPQPEVTSKSVLVGWKDCMDNLYQEFHSHIVDVTIRYFKNDYINFHRISYRSWIYHYV